jgi:hypothetical protein
MTTELWLLVASVILGLVHLIAASHLISFQYGYRWTASRREEPVPPLRGLANRGGPSNNEFFGNLPVLCGSGFSSACHSTSQFTHLLGGAPVFLGTLRIFARCGGQLCFTAFASFLEHRANRYRLLRHRAFPVTCGQRDRSARAQGRFQRAIKLIQVPISR